MALVISTVKHCTLRSPGRRAVLLTGKFEENQRSPPLPPTIHGGLCPILIHFCAQRVIHQGGIGTLGQAMYAGRPMLVVPFSHDQPDMPSALSGWDLVRIPRAKFSVRSGEAAWRELLEDRRYAVMRLECDAVAPGRRRGCRVRSPGGCAGMREGDDNAHPFTAAHSTGTRFTGSSPTPAHRLLAWRSCTRPHHRAVGCAR